MARPRRPGMPGLWASLSPPAACRRRPTSCRRVVSGCARRPQAADMTSRDDELLSILQKFFNPREEGWLWLASYVGDDPRGVVSQVEGAYEDVEVTGRSLARIINEVGADRYWLALCRREGCPTESDREVWRLVRDLVSADALTDMVMFNRDRAWSMREEDAAAVPL